MNASRWGALLLVLLAGAAWFAWPCAKAPLVAQADAGVVGNSPLPNSDPTATGAIEISAPAAAMIAVQSKGYRRGFMGEHALIDHVPIGEYEVFATGADGSANAKISVLAGETAHVELKLAAPLGAVALRGAVRDILGGTVAGAEVWVGLSITRTDGEGRFEIQVLPGEHEIRLRAVGYAERTAKVTLWRDRRVDFVLHPAATLRGIVVHADGTPAGGARVAVAGNDAFDTLADVEGNFTIEGPAGGRFEVRASTATEIGVAEHLAVAPAELHEVRIELTGAVAIFGRILGADGARIAGATVTLEGDLHAAEAETTSASDGPYRFSPVLPGSVTVKACAEGYLCSSSPSRYVVKTAAAPLDVILGAGSTLRLHIVDANGAPVANAHAYLGDFEGCESDVDGDCFIDHLQPRRTKVTADHPTAGHLSDEVLDIGPGETRYTVRLVRGGTVRGTVHWDDGKPAAGVEVSDRILSTRASTQTGADGRYELTNVDDRFAHIRVHASERVDQSPALAFLDLASNGGAEQTIEVLAGEVREGVDFVLRRESKTISGTVVDSSGAPLASAAVGLLKEGRFFEVAHDQSYLYEDPLTYADASGTFTLENVADAEYILWASAEHQPRGIARHVKAGSANVRVKVPAAATIEGVVKDEGGAPVKRFDVRVDDDRHERIFDAAGHFTLKGFTNGKHRLAIEGAVDENGATCLIELDAKAGETSHVTCTLEPSVTVSARIVTWPDGRPVAGARLSVNGRVRRESEGADADGRIRIESVGIGDVELHSFDVLGDREQWRRTVGRPSPFDLGDLAVGEKRGYPSIQYHLNVVDMEVLSIDGRDVTKLGDRSLYGALEAAREGAPIVVKKPDGEIKIVVRPAHRNGE